MFNQNYAWDIHSLHKRQSKERAILAFFLYVAYFTYFLLPICTQIVPRIFRFALYFLIPAYALYINIDQYKQMSRDTFLFLIYVCLFIVAFYYGEWKNSSSLFDYFFTVFFFWLPMLFFEDVIELPSWTKKWLRLFFWSYIFITMVTTSIGNVQYSEASRDLASYTPYADMYRSLNIGDYHFVYGVTILVPYILYEIKTSKISGKIIFTVVLGTVCALVIITQYAIAVIICAVEIIFLLVMKAKNKITMLLKCLLIVAIVYFIKDSIPNWLLSLREIFEDADMASLAERCTMLEKFITGKGATGDMANRGKLYLTSWQAFCERPLLGNLTGTFVELGGHSELLDILGGTGLAGFSLFLCCMSYYIRKIRKYIVREDLVYVIASFVGLTILFSVNTGLFQAVGMMAFMSAPLVLRSRGSRTYI